MVMTSWEYKCSAREAGALSSSRSYARRHFLLPLIHQNRHPHTLIPKTHAKRFQWKSSQFVSDLDTLATLYKI